MRRIVLSAPGKNSLSTAVLEGIRRDFEAAGHEPVLFTGDGDAFCAGLNLKELATATGPAMRKLLEALDGAVEAIFHHPAPTVALVNGHAIAGGAVLALCCDVVVASANPRIRIGMNETAIGLPFPPKVTAMVRYRIPAGNVEKVLLGAGLHAPEEAKALGLVDVVAEDAAAAAERELTRRAAHSSQAYAINKRQLRAWALARLENDRLFEEILKVWDSDATRATAAAALKGK